MLLLMCCLWPLQAGAVSMLVCLEPQIICIDNFADVLKQKFVLSCLRCDY